MSYVDNPTALHLRATNMIYEVTQERGTTILLPSSIVDSLNTGVPPAVAGQAAQITLAPPRNKTTPWVPRFAPIRSV